jgi:hypothetical protein
MAANAEPDCIDAELRALAAALPIRDFRGA